MANAPYRYWLALGFVVVAWVVVTLLVRSRAGHAMAAVRENEARAAVLGFGTYRVKLLADRRRRRSSAGSGASSTPSCSAAPTRT